MNIIRKVAVAGYEGLYEVDELGNIFSIKRPNAIGGLLKFTPDSFGYLRVGFSKDNKVKTYKAHRIVAAAFIPNPDNKPQVNHINGIKTDNRVENLEWATQKENINHAWGIGLSKNKKGHKSLLSKLNKDQRIQMLTDYVVNRASQKQVAKKYSISQPLVSMIMKQFVKDILTESGEAINQRLTQK